MPIVTISRQFGAAGRPVGLGVARRLGASLLDRQLVAAAARRAGLTVEEAEGYDEGVPTLLQRLAAALSTRIPDPVVVPASDDPEGVVTAHDRLSALTRSVIEEAADRGDAVILGRGAAHVLRRRPGVLHVQLHASVEDRVRLLERRVAEIPVEELPPDTALDARSLRQLCEEMDARRAAYIRRQFDVDWLDVSHYDLSLDMGRIEAETAVDLIELAVRRATIDPAAGSA